MTRGTSTAPEQAVARDAQPDELSSLKDSFLASLNHEMRTPLSGILGMADLLLETRLDEEQREYVKATKLCAENLLEVLNATLEYSALKAGSLWLEEAEFPLAEMLRTTVQEHSGKADAKGLRLTCTVDPSLPATVVGDALRLRQAISHLLGNALKFTSEGEVELMARGQLLSGGRLLTVISVRDTGIGIPPDQLGVIFESFRQLESGLSRSYTGLGLGLALAQKLVGLMGGEISADSESGRGSTFSLSVPLKVPEGAANDGSQRTWRGSPEYRILVVEDNDVAQRVVSHILRRGPYAVECVDSGPNAVRAAANNRYDLILMDLQMPGMNGLEATTEIRRIGGYENTPILAFTANSSDEYRALCRERGLQAFLPKPVRSEELLSTVAQFLN